MFLDKIGNTPKQALYDLEYLKKSELPLILSVDDQYLKHARRFLLLHDITVDHLIVNERIFVSNAISYNYPLEEFNNLLNNYPEVNLVVVHEKYIEEVKQLSQNQKISKYIPLDLFSFERDFIDFYDTIRMNAVELEKFYLKLADEHSRNIMVAFIKAMISGNPAALIGLNSKDEDRYFPDFFHLSKDEVFVDCGAYDGDTILPFINKTEGSYSKIYAFEPDKQNIENLKKNTAQFNSIEIIEKGCFSCKDTLCFKDGQGISSSIVSNGNFVIDVDAIDNVVSGKVSFIKMDIEGSELEALKGAKKTIRSYLPRLAVSVYHRSNDLYTIPAYIHELNDSYKFYLRHYGMFSAELVLYAISDHYFKK